MVKNGIGSVNLRMKQYRITEAKHEYDELILKMLF